jgi:hypothetical protein
MKKDFNILSPTFLRALSVYLRMYNNDRQEEEKLRLIARLLYALILILVSAMTATILVLTLTSAAPPAANHKPPARPVFAFHSGFWINLHHFLYYQALLHAPGGKTNTRKLSYRDTTEIVALDKSEQTIWLRAIDYYRRNLIQKDLLFDEDMVRAKDALEDQETNAGLKVSDALPAEWQSLLIAVAPGYRLHFWKQQDQLNRQWIADARPLLAEHGPRIAATLEKDYLTPWPEDTIRVDITNYASWSGAYTTTHPDRITISAVDTANRGPAALEVLFHEASHIVIDSLQTRIDQQCLQDNRRLPNDALWHALLFYTTGDVVKKELGGNYLPYAYKNGLWTRAWPMYITPLEQDWQPWLDRTTTIDAALEKLVRDVEVKN